MYQNTFSKAIKSNFKELKKSADNLDISASAGEETYYQFERQFKNELIEFIRLDFSVLNSRQLLQLCAWVSKYRPVEPFKFLIQCSLLNDKHS